MKKLTMLLSVLLVLCTVICCVSVACTPDEPDLTGLNAAKDYLEAQLKDEATETPMDYTLPAMVKNQYGTYSITWTASVSSGDANGVSVGETKDGFTTINVNEKAEADIVYVLTATLADADGNTVAATFNRKVAKLNLISIADFIALPVGDTVYAIEGYVMASGADEATDYKGSFVVADSTGAIFSYEKKVVSVGDKVLVWGKRSVNAGVAQISTTALKIFEKNSQDYAEATPVELKADDIKLNDLSDAAMPGMTGKYYKITGATLTMSDDGYTNASYKGKQLLSLYVNEELEVAIADYYDEIVNVYGYVRGYKNGSYLTVQVTKIEYGGEGEFVAKTAEEKVAYEKEALSLDTIAYKGKTELPTKGSRFSAHVTISWALADNAVATLADNVLTIEELPAARTTLTLTATLTCGDVTDTATITVDVRETWATLENKVAGATIKTFAELEELVPNKNDITSDKFYTIGWVKEITNPKYGNMTLVDADENEFIVYGSYGHDGVVRFDKLPNKPEVGDVVVVYGKMKNYNGTKEMENANIMQINHKVCVDTADYVIASLSVSSKVSANFELDEKATWTVKEGTAITIEGTTANVTVTNEEQTVVLTATVTINEITKTKDFTVKVVPPAEITIEEALKADKGTVVVITGVVTGFKYEWDAEYGNCSPYIVDGTGKTIVVFRTTTNVKINDIIEVFGTIDEYYGVKQIAQQGSVVTITDTHTECTTFSDATCTEAPKCTICGADKVDGEALGHTDTDPADGFCDVCGADTSIIEETIAIVANAGTLAGDSLSISWASTNFNVVGEKGGSSTAIRTSDSDHFRIYASSNLRISAKATQGIVKVVITCTTADYATACASSLTTTGATAVADDTTVTVTVTEGTLAEIAFTATAQFRINEIVVSYK